MFGFGRKNAAIDGLSEEIVAALAERVTPKDAEKLGKLTDKNLMKFAKTITDLQLKVTAFSAENRLGVYGKARLLNAIKWGLKNAGYSDDFIDATTTELVKSVAPRLKPR
ncbi:MAG: hypothetical protein U1F41_04820 [Burkholderiales bacterium]